MASGWQAPMSSSSSGPTSSNAQSFTLPALGGTSGEGPSTRPPSFFRPERPIVGPGGDAGKPPIPARAPVSASTSAAAKNQDPDEEVDADAIYGQQFTNFVRQAEEVTPTIPDAVTNYVMNTAGLQVEDPRILRLISLACQKFVADITNDAMQHCKIRLAQQLKAQKQTKPKFTLTMDDLLPTLKERGINVKKPPYYV